MASFYNDIALEAACFIDLELMGKRSTKADELIIDHCRRVAWKCIDLWGGDEVIVGLLHDVLEDCDCMEVTLPKLSEKFSPKICDAVFALTRCEGESYSDYIRRVSANHLARRVKLVDLMDNMNLTRLKNHPDMEDARRQVKYAKAFAKLMEVEAHDNA